MNYNALLLIDKIHNSKNISSRKSSNINQYSFYNNKNKNTINIYNENKEKLLKCYSVKPYLYMMPKDIILKDIFHNAIKSSNEYIKYSDVFNTYNIYNNANIDRKYIFEKIKKFIIINNINFNILGKTIFLYDLLLFKLDNMNNVKYFTAFYSLSNLAIALIAFTLILKFNNEAKKMISLRQFVKKFEEGNENIIFNDICEMEIMALQLIDYNLTFQTPFSFMDLFLLNGIIFSEDYVNSDLSFRIYELVNETLEKIMEKSNEYFKYNYFYLCCCVVMHIREKFKMNRWPKALEISFDVNYEQFYDIYNTFFIKNNKNNNYMFNINNNIKSLYNPDIININNLKNMNNIINVLKIMKSVDKFRKNKEKNNQDIFINKGDKEEKHKDNKNNDLDITSLNKIKIGIIKKNSAFFKSPEKSNMPKRSISSILAKLNQENKNNLSILYNKNNENNKKENDKNNSINIDNKKENDKKNLINIDNKKENDKNNLINIENNKENEQEIDSNNNIEVDIKEYEKENIIINRNNEDIIKKEKEKEKEKENEKEKEKEKENEKEKEKENEKENNIQNKNIEENIQNNKERKIKKYDKNNNNDEFFKKENFNIKEKDKIKMTKSCNRYRKSININNNKNNQENNIINSNKNNNKNNNYKNDDINKNDNNNNNFNKDGNYYKKASNSNIYRRRYYFSKKSCHLLSDYPETKKDLNNNIKSNTDSYNMSIKKNILKKKISNRYYNNYTFKRSYEFKYENKKNNDLNITSINDFLIYKNKKNKNDDKNKKEYLDNYKTKNKEENSNAPTCESSNIKITSNDFSIRKSYRLKKKYTKNEVSMNEKLDLSPKKEINKENEKEGKKLEKNKSYIKLMDSKISFSDKTYNRKTGVRKYYKQKNLLENNFLK